MASSQQRAPNWSEKGSILACNGEPSARIFDSTAVGASAGGCECVFECPRLPVNNDGGVPEFEVQELEETDESGQVSKS